MPGYLSSGHFRLRRLAHALRTEAAISSNFSLTDLWIFRATKPVVASWPRRALRYNSVAFLGLLAISVAVLAGLTHFLLDLHYLLVNLFAIGAGTLWNYTGSCYFAWAAKKIGHPPASRHTLPFRDVIPALPPLAGNASDTGSLGVNPPITTPR